MSREVPADPQKWTEEDKWYVFSRTPLAYPQELDPPETPYPTSDNLDHVTAVPTRTIPLEEQSVPAIGEPGGIIGGNDEDYEEGWNNNQRRAELSRRGLSVDGNKEALIARLLRSDRDELEDDDLSKVD